MRTGKLNQFKGYYTPRPMPQNIQRLYASIWAGWSAWSFCVNNAQIRVRACNTVRGFSCLGPNQETKECAPDAKKMKGFNSQHSDSNRINNDYDAVDPWEEDRREAMKQLYSDYDNGNNDLFKNKALHHRQTTIRPNIKAGGKNVHMERPIENVAVVFPKEQEINIHEKTRSPDGSPGYKPDLLYPTTTKEIKASEIVTTTERNDEIRTTMSSMDSKNKYITTSETLPETKPRIVQPIRATSYYTPLNKSPSIVMPQRTTVKEHKMRNEIFSKPERVYNFKTLSSVSTPTPVTPTTKQPTTTKNMINEDIDVIEPLPENTNIKETFEKSLVPAPSSEIVHSSLNQTKTPVITSTTITIEQPTTTTKLYTTTIPPATIINEIIPQSPKPIFIKDGEVKGLGIRKLKIPKISHVINKKVEHDVSTFDNKHEGDVEEEQRDTENALQFMIQNMAKAVNKKVNSDSGVKLERLPSNDHDLLFNEKYMKKNVEIRRKPVSAKKSSDSTVEPPSYDDLDDETKLLLESTLSDDTNLNDPDSIREEIRKLSKLMKEVEGEMIESDFTTTIPDIATTDMKEHMTVEDSLRRAMSDNAKSIKLVPQDSGFLSNDKIPLPAIVTQNEESKGRPFQTQLGTESQEAQWSDWKEWNECFCNKQVRTRTCIFDNAYHTSGCVGESYESRDCITTRPCPALERKRFNSDNSLKGSSSLGIKQLNTHTSKFE
uniref:Chitin-binding type-2 domain-containing protein n=1 Tax=Parastrongyloides trichosuri TaxID=131310 RepID=A0A0N4ZAK9_PARTI